MKANWVSKLLQMRSITNKQFSFKFLAPKETVVLHQWENETKIWFYRTSWQRLIPTVKDLEFWRFEWYSCPSDRGIVGVLGFYDKNDTEASKPVVSHSNLPYQSTTTWKFVAYPHTTGTKKATKILNKNSSFNWTHSILKESTNASHSINLFTTSCHYISTNDKAPPHPHENRTPTIPLFTLMKGLTFKMSAFQSFDIGNLTFINSFDKTKVQFSFPWQFFILLWIPLKIHFY